MIFLDEKKKKNVFLTFVQNIDCGWVPTIYVFIEAVVTCTHNLCFGAKIRNLCIPL